FSANHAAGARGRFQDDRVDAELLECPSARQAADSGSDDGYLWHGPFALGATRLWTDALRDNSQHALDEFCERSDENWIAVQRRHTAEVGHAGVGGNFLVQNVQLVKR